jgi:hypothetical protein
MALFITRHSSLSPSPQHDTEQTRSSRRHINPHRARVRFKATSPRRCHLSPVVSRCTSMDVVRMTRLLRYLPDPSVDVTSKLCSRVPFAGKRSRTRFEDG